MKNFFYMKFRPLALLVALCSLAMLMAFVPAGKKKKLSKKASVTKVKAATKIQKAEENPYYIIVDKSDYELKVYDDEGWYATYPIVFGSKKNAHINR